MKRQLQRPWALTQAFLQNPVVILVSRVIAIVSLIIALEANAQAASLARERAADSQHQAEVLRETFCRFFVPINEAGKQPSPTPRSALGQSILDGSIHATEQLRCPLPERKTL